MGLAHCCKQTTSQAVKKTGPENCLLSKKLLPQSHADISDITAALSFSATVRSALSPYSIGIRFNA